MDSRTELRLRLTQERLGQVFRAQASLSASGLLGLAPSLPETSLKPTGTNNNSCMLWCSGALQVHVGLDASGRLALEAQGCTEPRRQKARPGTVSTSELSFIADALFVPRVRLLAVGALQAACTQACASQDYST